MNQFEQFIRNNKTALDGLEPNYQVGWEQLQRRLHQSPPPPKSKPIRSLFIAQPLWRVAALVLLVVGLSIVTNMVYPNFFSSKKNSIVQEKTADSFKPHHIVLNAPDNTPVALSSLKGKVVLVQFWASWSDTCKDANCSVYQPIYDKYQDLGFEIYAISLDTNKEAWEDCVEQNCLSWIQVSDLQGFASPVCQLCAVKDVPTTILLDQQQRVIAKNLNGKELEHKLQELLIASL